MYEMHGEEKEYVQSLIAQFFSIILPYERNRVVFCQGVPVLFADSSRLF